MIVDEKNYISEFQAHHTPYTILCPVESMFTERCSIQLSKYSQSKPLLETVEELIVFLSMSQGIPAVRNKS